jgi:mRNA-degrading endonuclease RelE of RelBE toxin-antitoxin system
MAERLYRLRAGEYRLVYEVDEEKKEIVIHYLRHRQKVYRNL